MNFEDLMQKTKALQEQLQSKLQATQSKLSQTVVSGEAGGGLVKVEIYAAKHDVKRVHLDPSILSEPLDVMSGLIAAAFNDAIRKAEYTAQKEIEQLATHLPRDFLKPGSSQQENTND